MNKCNKTSAFPILKQYYNKFSYIFIIYSNEKSLSVFLAPTLPHLKKYFRFILILQSHIPYIKLLLLHTTFVISISLSNASYFSRVFHAPPLARDFSCLKAM